ncbi:MAG: DUF2141 domain-containing protein [Erythrobacter sp.]
MRWLNALAKNNSATIKARLCKPSLIAGISGAAGHLQVSVSARRLARSTQGFYEVTMSNHLRHSLKRAQPLGRAMGVCALILASTSVLAQPASSNGFRNKIAHNTAHCTSGRGPSVLVTINEIKSSSGTIRVQSYRGTKQEWLEKGKWINRIELPAKAGSMTVCMPVPVSGVYGIAVRHDTNNNGKTEIRKDGGAMSNNPSLNIFNLGKPSYKKTRFNIGPGVERISIRMRYM